MKITHGVVHEVPDDMEKALTTNKQILDKWNSLTPIQRNEWICWVTIVKKQKQEQNTLSVWLKNWQMENVNPAAGQAACIADLLQKSGFRNLKHESNPRAR